MIETNTNNLPDDRTEDGVDRRGFLSCMAWAGTGAFFLMQGGVLKSYSLGRLPAGDRSSGELSFVQISDSHMGFNKPANQDVVGTLQTAVGRINALGTPPDKKRLVLFDDSGHNPRAEEPDKFYTEVSGFLASVWP